jgi:hypothetical protein
MNMGKELRTLSFYVVATDATVIAQHLFDRAARIKKMVFNASLGGLARGGGNVTFGKHPSVQIHARPGDFAHVQLNQVFEAAQGGGSVVSNNDIDLGEDYVDVEEDEFLYLVAYSSIAALSVYGHVVIYYYDI